MIDSIRSSDSFQMQILPEMASRKSRLSETQIMSPPVSPPQGRGLFADLGTNLSGRISQSEFEILAKGISKVTGWAVDIKQAYSTYDSDGNDELSGEELHQAMSGLGIEPPPSPPQQPAMGIKGEEQSVSELNVAIKFGQSSSFSGSGQAQGASIIDVFPSQYSAYQKLMPFLNQKNEKPELMDATA
jgi:hypothetical protein